MRIVIETVEHSKNRNDQVGDYQYLPDGTLYISVSEMGDPKMNFLIACHEMIEEFLAKCDGVTEEHITAYDELYESKRKLGMVPIDSENGFGSDCLYKRYHTIATGVEMILAAQLGVDWSKYSEKVNSL